MWAIVAQRTTGTLSAKRERKNRERERDREKQVERLQWVQCHLFVRAVLTTHVSLSLSWIILFHNSCSNMTQSRRRAKNKNYHKTDRKTITSLSPSWVDLCESIHSSAIVSRVVIVSSPANRNKNFNKMKWNRIHIQTSTNQFIQHKIDTTAAFLSSLPLQITRNNRIEWMNKKKKRKN